MSEVLDSYKKRNLQWKLNLSTEFPLHYVTQQSFQQYEFLFCVAIPWPLVRLWSEILDEASVELTYIDLLNATIVDGWFRISRECTRIEELL